MISALLFDWHGVLDQTLLEGLFQRIAQEGKCSVEVVRVTLGSTARSLALGNINDQEFWNFTQQEMRLSFTQLKKVRSYINSIIPNTHLWKALPRLKEKYVLAILSDCPQEKVDVINEYAGLEIFNHIFFSAECHQDKKMPEFFEHAAQTMSLKPQQILFIDDNQKNINFASQLGFQTHLFKDTNEFLTVVNRL